MSKQQIKKPEKELPIMKAIPHIQLQERFKEVAKLKSDLIKENNKIMLKRNKEMDVIIQESLKKTNLTKEYNEIMNKFNVIIGKNNTNIIQYEGMMRILIEFLNKRKK